MKVIEFDFDTQELQLTEREQPTPSDGEALVRTTRVGLDGTDFHTLTGEGGTPPDNSNSLVLGHEAVGVIEDPNDTNFEKGDYVVPTVRRQLETGEAETYFQNGEQDMAPIDAVIERGIHRQDGFMQEYFTSEEKHLVRIPDKLAEYGFLVEPISISEKALDLAEDARSGFHWNPNSALVLGNGRLGLVTVAMLEADDRFDTIYCLGRTDRPDKSIELLERLGAEYIHTKDTTLENFKDTYNGVDLVFETTGVPQHVIDSVYTLNPTGVVMSLGVPSVGNFSELDLGKFQFDLVLNNKAIIGSVNSRDTHFETAIDRIEQIPDWFLDDYSDGIFSLENYEDAFTRDDEFVKTAVDFEK